MVKNLLLISVGMIIHLNTYTMEKEQCWLGILSVDIRNLIASFLDDIETEEEFIQRTTNIKNSEQKIPAWCFDLIPQKQFGMALQHAYCPDQKYIALLQSSQQTTSPIYPYAKSLYQKLFIIDTEKQTLFHEQKLINGCYSNITLAPRADAFAVTYLECDSSQQDFALDNIKYKTMMTVYKTKIFPAKTKVFELYKKHDVDAFGFIAPSLFFNKQGTHIIAHYINYDTSHKPIQQYRIIPLNPKKPAMITEKTLENYFKQRSVCKDIMKSVQEKK